MLSHRRPMPMGRKYTPIGSSTQRQHQKRSLKERFNRTAGGSSKQVRVCVGRGRGGAGGRSICDNFFDSFPQVTPYWWPVMNVDDFADLRAPRAFFLSNSASVSPPHAASACTGSVFLGSHCCDYALTCLPRVLAVVLLVLWVKSCWQQLI